MPKLSPISPARLLLETIRTGTIASIAIMPIGFAFRQMDLRIGYYGPKVVELLVSPAQPWQVFILHILVGWISTLPLLLGLLWVGSSRAVQTGLLYGAGYYVLINSIILPWAFDDPTPWQIGWLTVLPSLLAHIAFGWIIVLSARRRIASLRT